MIKECISINNIKFETISIHGPNARSLEIHKKYVFSLLWVDVKSRGFGVFEGLGLMIGGPFLLK